MTSSEWWDDEFDVVVVGGGGAGFMAAVEAADAGATVLLIEKQPGGGGATAMSVGSLTAAGTPQQAKAGIEDTVDAHYEDLMAMMKASAMPGREYDRDLSRLMVEVAPKALARLMELGLEFSGPHPEPPHTVYRMHNVLPGSDAYIDTLSDAAAARGVVVRTETSVQELQREPDGSVSAVGIRHVRSHQTRAVKVNRAVVLAAGDFSANDELARANGRPPELSAIDPIRSYATGDGLLVATAIGAAAIGLERGGGAGYRTVLPPYCAPNHELFPEGAILVNRDGKRFANELVNSALAANEQPGKIAFLIFDGRTAGRIAVADDDTPGSRDGWYRKDKLYLCTFPGVAYAYLDDLLQKTDYLVKAASIDELAERIGVPAETLAQTVREYNSVRPGDKDALGRVRGEHGLDAPPFYAFGPVKPVNVFSGGGLRVDREMRVLDEQGKPIPRLYACGANAEAVPFLGGHGHHLAWAFGTGQIAGKNAAGEKAG